MPPVNDLDNLIATLEAFRPLLPLAEAAGATLVSALESGRKLLTCGNGGSAADALHTAQELVGRYRTNRRPLPAICLCADATGLTCIGNDFGYEQVFSRQVEAFGQPGDVLVLFSTSGNSANLLYAAETARAKSVTTIGMLGKTGGKLAPYCDQAIIVPSSNTARIQEVHTFIMHLWMERIEVAFPEPVATGALV